jgi:hypothetical protein
MIEAPIRCTFNQTLKEDLVPMLPDITNVLGKYLSIFPRIIVRGLPTRLHKPVYGKPLKCHTLLDPSSHSLPYLFLFDLLQSEQLLH